MKIAEAERRWRPLFLARMKKQKAKERIKINGPKIKETAAAFIFLFLYFIMAPFIFAQMKRNKKNYWQK